MIKKNAFTLAEVLITLAIIGVIAALTIKTLNANVNEREATTKLIKVYNTLQVAVSKAIADNGTPDTWINSEVKAENAQKQYEILKPYLNVARYCGLEAGTECFSADIKRLNGYVEKGWFGLREDRVKFVLADGSAIAIVGGSIDCSSNSADKDNENAPEILSQICFGVNIDINGNKAPNQRGKDVFDFQIAKNGQVLPLGAPGFAKNWSLETCNDKTQGSGCTAWVVLKGNMDYLRREVSWNEP